MLEETQEVANEVGKQHIIDDILEFLPSEVEISLDLPSKGRFYKSCPGGTVRVRPMQFSDEKALLNAKKSNVDPINLLLEKCVEGMNTSELLQQDKLFLIMKIRELSYGEEYKTIVTCDKCNFDNHSTFNLSKLPIKEIPDEITNPMELDLPVLKKKVIVKLPTLRDEHFLADVDEIDNNLWRFILEIAGNKDKAIISEVCKKLPLKDIHALVNCMNPDFGVQTLIKYECQECKSFNVITLPITPDFFSTN